MRFAYADPPYFGRCKLYDHHHPDGRCWDDLETHRLLIERLCNEFPDGWALSGSMKSLWWLLPLCPEDVIVLSWVKLNALPTHDKRPQAWEPVIMRGGRTPKEQTRTALVAIPPPGYTFVNRPGEHVIGEKPEKFCHWLFRIAGLEATDEFVDLFAGSGTVARAWDAWSSQGHFDWEVA